MLINELVDTFSADLARLISTPLTQNKDSAILTFVYLFIMPNLEEPDHQNKSMIFILNYLGIVVNLFSEIIA